ncbi:ATP-dependent helicase, partial [bacterium]|nr:ATP-dependent helicase [bacterium]
AYLTLLENSRDIAALIRVLENPPYPLNLDSTIKIGSLIHMLKEESDKNETPLTYIDVLNSILSNPGTGGYAKRKAEKLKQVFTSFIVIKDSLTTAQLIYSIIEEIDYFKMIYSGDLFLAENKRAVLKEIYSMSLLFEKRSDYKTSLKDFIKYLKYRIEGGDILTDESDREGVTFLTVHKAKGLEFDYVFFCDIRSDEKKDIKAALLLDIDKNKTDIQDGDYSGYGIVQKYKDYDIGRNSGKTEKYEKSVERGQYVEKINNEEIRGEYVALTRAKEMLYLTATKKKEKLPLYFDYMLEKFGDKDYAEVVTDTERNGEKYKPVEDSVGLSSADDCIERLVKSYASGNIGKSLPKSKQVIELNFSMLKEFIRCPRKYKYIYENKYSSYRPVFSDKEIDDSKGSRGSFHNVKFGLAVHKVLENIYNVNMEPMALLEEVLTGDRISKDEFEFQYKKRGEKIFKNFSRLGLDKREPVHTE